MAVGKNITLKKGKGSNIIFRIIYIGCWKEYQVEWKVKGRKF